MPRLIARLSAFALTLVFAAAGSTCTSAVLAKDVQIKGYTKKDGTVIKAYTKHVKDDDTKSGAASDKKEDKKADKDAKVSTTEDVKEKTTKKDADGSKTVEVKGYTKKDGTVVKGYTRKKSSK